MTTKSALELRLDELQTLALETFGSKDMAERWLHKKNFILGTTPISMAESESGLMEVKKILNAIIYGGVV